VKAIPTGSRLLDEPYMQARPQKAEEYGLAALNRARDGVMGTTAVHICFGYAAIIHERPSGYSFLIQLKNCSCCQVSIETAPIQLDCSSTFRTRRQGSLTRRHRPF
jgi:5-methyltetrahydropteroyltriglutamate--homocysteine methyltransferase